MFVRLHFQTIFHLSLAISHSFFERKFCKELRTYVWKSELATRHCVLPKNLDSLWTIFLAYWEHSIQTNEREAANVFSNNKLCHLSLLLQEKHFKSRNAFKSWMYHVATVIGSYFQHCISNHYYSILHKKILIVTMNPSLHFLLWNNNCNVCSTLVNSQIDRQCLNGAIVAKTLIK